MRTSRSFLPGRREPGPREIARRCSNVAVRRRGNAPSQENKRLPHGLRASPTSATLLVGYKAMGIIHKCPGGQGSGSPSPKGRARALAPSQSYRFVSNSHGLLLPTGRRPQISSNFLPFLLKGGCQEPAGRDAFGPQALPVRSSRCLNRVDPSSSCSTDPRKRPGLISNSCLSPGPLSLRELTFTSRR